MRIGIITYYRVANFGANLQAVSTYRFLERAGHTPIFIHYMSRQLYDTTDGCYDSNPQVRAHLDFIDSVILRQTETCLTVDDINRAIERHAIEAVIIGSDAVLQHHPLLSRIHLYGRRLIRIRVDKVNDERLFPNLFWGFGINPDIKKAFMSVSSQNSQYQYFSKRLRQRMAEALKTFSYISVRDTWTQQMVHAINGSDPPLTPDPVFAFNQNAGNLIPTREETLRKFHLPERYLLVSFLNVHVPADVIHSLKRQFEGKAECVALPTPLGMRYQHDYDHEIPLPLSPTDWYALIKHSAGYIGNNMHPVVIALHNGVPCFSIDNYSNYDFFRRPKNDGASKILDLLRRFQLSENHIVPHKDNTRDLEKRIYDRITTFPTEDVMRRSLQMYTIYEQMMHDILKTIAL